MPSNLLLDKTNRKTRFNQYPVSYLALSLFALLLAIYSLTFSGTFISDDEHILASRTISLALDGYINDSRVIGNGRVFSYANSTPVYAAQGLNIEPGQAIIGSLLVRLARFLGTGNVQTIFLLNIWVTALTGVVLFISVLFCGYSRLTAFVSALLFGVGTLAWPYTQTYFRDVLAMLFVTISWACSFFIVTSSGKKHKPKTTNALNWFFLSLSLFAGILTKNTIVLAAPVLIIYLSVSKFTDKPQFNFGLFLGNYWKRIIVVFGSILIIIVIWLKFIPSTGLLARYSLNYYISLFIKFFHSPHPYFWEAIAGPLFSPGKSIFLYSPILLLSTVGLYKRWRLAWPAWIFLLLLILGQALFYDGDWWGHINWGLRYLLPALPLLMIASAPAIEWLLKTWKSQILLICLSTFSIMIQLLGVLVPSQKYFVELYNINSSISESLAIWNPKFSPIRWHFDWIINGSPLDLATLRIGELAIPLIISIILVIGIIIFGFTQDLWSGLPVLAMLMMISISVTMLFVYKNDPAYIHSRKDLEAAKNHIARYALPDDIILIKSYGTPAWTYWMNWADQGPQWAALPYYFPSPELIEEYYSTEDPEVAMDEISLTLLQDIPYSFQRVWLVLPDDSPGANLNLERTWIAQQSNLVKLWGFSGVDHITQTYLYQSTSQINP
jgi:hypothetical protein